MIKFPKFQFEEWVALGIFALGLALRLRWVGMPPHLDEIWHYGIVANDSLSGAIAESRTVAHPPIYFLFLWAWSPLGSSIEWLRSLSACASAGGAVVAYLLVARLGFSRIASFSIGIVAAALPAMLFVGTMVRAYALCQLFLWVNLYAFVAIAVDGIQKKRMWALSLSGVLAMLTIHAAIFQVGVTSCAFLFLYLRQQRLLGTPILPRARELLPHSLLLLLPIPLFLLQYSANFTDHTRSYIYQGSYTDLWSLVGFIGRRLAIYGEQFLEPFNQPLVLGGLVLLAFCGWSHVLARQATAWKALFFIALATLGLQVLAAVIGLYPLAGRYRHDSPTYPAAILFCTIGVFLLLERPFSAAKVDRRLLLALTAVVLSVPIRASIMEIPHWQPERLLTIVWTNPKLPLHVTPRGNHLAEFAAYAAPERFSRQDYTFDPDSPLISLGRCVEQHGGCRLLTGGFYSTAELTEKIAASYPLLNFRVLAEEQYAAGKAVLYHVNSALVDRER